MKIIVIIAFFLFITNCKNKQITHDSYSDIARIYPSDTLKYYRKHQLNRSNLPDLWKVSTKHYFRLSDDRYAVDIWTDDSGSYNGLLTFYITKLKPRNITGRKNYLKLKYKRKIHYQKKTINSEISEKVFNLFDSLGIFAMRDGRDIKEWVGAAGHPGTYIEQTINGTYSLKFYPTSSRRDASIFERENLNLLISELEKMLEISQLHNDFIENLPRGEWIYGQRVIKKERKGRVIFL